MKNGNETGSGKSFEKWRSQEIERGFGLKKKDALPALREWLTVSGEIPAVWQNFLEELRQALFLNGGAWNETELLGRFIHPFLRTLNFANPQKQIEEYSARSLILFDERFPAKGNVDWFVARGAADEPQNPYLFLHEYKRLQSASADPLGQLLIAMLAAQRLNNDKLSVYGAWVMGDNWKFVLLDDKIYSESRTYDAADKDGLTQIWLILNKTKQIIYDRVDAIIVAEKTNR